jgi:hypothetical protein
MKSTTIWEVDARTGSLTPQAVRSVIYCDQALKAVPKDYFIRSKAEFLKIPNGVDEIGQMPLCDTCAHQITCILNKMPPEDGTPVSDLSI